MALQAAYEQFLAAPNSSFLTDDATLHYVTTTTSYRGATDIIKHLNSVSNQVKKKKQEVLSTIEGQFDAAIEVDTVLEFVTGGASYLPGLDDNFLADRTVYLPIMHIVSFDAEGRIRQIRQSWDQGSLLKQLDVIGRTGRNWPIRDSKEQIKLIEACLKATGGAPTAAAQDAGFNPRARGNSNNALRDPHASLALFAPREEAEQESPANVISPKAGRRPRQRDFAEILGDEPVEDVGSPSAGRGFSDSPSKAVAPKAGAGKNFQPNRLFDAEDGLPEMPDSPAEPVDRFYRPNPKKFNHFDFGDDPEEHIAADPTPVKTKHSSQWNFDDFNTPAKVRPSRALQKSHQDVRHWGTEDDEVQETPVHKPVVPKPRRDAEPHFEFKDDGVPTEDPRPSRPRGASHNTGLGLYENNLYSEEGAVPDVADADADAETQALGNITNLKNRSKTFNPQFKMTDDPPSPHPEAQAQRVGQDRMKAVKMMDANWAAYDESPQKENQPAKPKPKPAAKASGGGRGIHIGGDGMGGSKGTDRNWLFGEGDDEEPPKALPTRKATAKSGGFNWDF